MFYSIYSLTTNTFRWYTDGCKTDKGTGAGPGINIQNQWKFTHLFQAEINPIGRRAPTES